YPAEKLSTKTEKFKSQKLQRKQIFEFGNIDVLEDFAKIEGLKNGKILNPMSQDVANELFRRLIKLPQLHANQIIENSVKDTTGITIPTIKSENPYNTYRPFIELLASEEPAPGGGSVSALAGVLGAALGEMVSNLTRSKKKYIDNWEPTKEILDNLHQYREKMIAQVVDDAEAYNFVAAAMKLPKKTDAELEIRKAAYQKALKIAIQTPFDTAMTAVKIVEELTKLVEVSAPAAITDIGVGALLCKSAFEGAVYNIRINLLDLEDADYRTGVLATIDSLRFELDNFCESVKQNVENSFE
ncbi:MAG: cyclodeaminase/cyclohydrolase family protein, partial [Planctomycetes bacterium]|nr:cyclodeaminase/cyclohydrolase family protein [Planctomycetota bacterium]